MGVPNVYQTDAVDSTHDSSVATATSADALTPRIGAIRVIIVNNLIHEASDFSDVARAEPNFDERMWLKRDRYISGLALANIEQNVRNLAEEPEVEVLHLSDVNERTVSNFDPDAIVLSGTLRDFDYYRPEMIETFGRFVRKTSVPILGICGGHQLVGLAFGAKILTLDRLEQSDRRENRLSEYQYRYVKVLHDDPIFDRIDDSSSGVLPAGCVGRRGILRVWQNHGLMIDRVPAGFELLASGYLCPVQMLVRRSNHQLIYTVQFHIEKSFEDFNRPKAFWDHHVESRDGRIIFENFLVEALKHREAVREI